MTNSIWAAAALGALAGFLGGASFHLLADDSRAAAASPVERTDTADVDRLVRALAGLTDELERLLAEPRLAAPARAEGAPLRVPVEVDSLPASGTSPAEWTAALERLTAALRRPSGTPDATTPLFLPPPTAAAGPVPLLSTEDQAESLRRGLLLHGFQDVIDRYGIPERIRTHQNGSGMTWYYGVLHGEDYLDLRVHFTQGLVTDVDIDLIE